jgi:hypothetical protein
MSVFDDNELKRQMDEESKHVQRIPQDVVQYLRDMVDQKISTGKISANVTAKVREEWAHQMAWHEHKINEHDQKIGEHDGFLSKLRRGLFGIVK